MSPTTRHIALVLAPLVVLAGIVCLQARYDAIVAEYFDIRAPVHRSAMPASVVRHLAFGFDNMLADYYWITAVQSYLKWDGFDAYYPEYFETIRTLDPKFEYPYQFAILTLPTKRNPESFMWLSDVTEGGVRSLPQSYKIPFSAASQFYVVGKDNERATHFLEVASKMASAPELVHRSYAIYLMRDATDYKKSRALFTAILETAENDETKKIVVERIQLLDFIEGLEQSIAKFKTSHGVYPVSIEELSKKEKLKFSESTTALLRKYSPTINPASGKILLR